MKKQLWWVLALIVCAGVGAAEYRWSPGPANAKEADAAYRDGSYLAKMDVAQGRKPHFSIGRWSADQDRASFIAGYQKTYRELADAHSIAQPSPVELVGFRDGLLDGARHRKAAQPFQVNKTENYRKADANDYRDAYSNGYQQGYYSVADNADLRTISQTSGPF